MPFDETRVSTRILGLIEDGAMTPSLAVEKNVEVAKDTVALPGPSSEGVATPSCPVEVAVASEKKVVIPASPSVVDAGTKVGVMIPSPLVTIRVDVPETYVVVAPWMMVVISTETTVCGVAGCATIVRVRVAVHSQDVEYTAHQ
jgi:hypothetical protein